MSDRTPIWVEQFVDHWAQQNGITPNKAPAWLMDFAVELLAAHSNAAPQQCGEAIAWDGGKFTRCKLPNKHDGNHSEYVSNTGAAPLPEEPSIIHALRITAPGSSWMDVLNYIDALRAALVAARGDLAYLLTEYDRVTDRAESAERREREALEAVKDAAYVLEHITSDTSDAWFERNSAIIERAKEWG